MSNILYHNQHKLNQKPIYEPTTFKIMLEAADKDLVGFFDELYEGTNPAKKLVSLCYFLVGINNKYINGIKVEIGSYLQTSGASATSIDTLVNLRLSVSRMTVNRQKKIVSNEHEQSVDNSIVYAISTRLRPKLMTALGAIIALMPLALGIGAGAELHQPLAIAVIGGFLIALPLLLIVLPAMLRLLYKNQKTTRSSHVTA